MRRCNKGSMFGEGGCHNRALPGSHNCKAHGGKTPPVMIGLTVGDSARFSDFIPSIIGLHKPEGSGFKKVTTLGPAMGFNLIAQTFLDNPAYKYLFLTNDDNLCPPDTIYRLMDRDVDVVSGLYFGRIMPFEPILFDKWTWENALTEDSSIKKRWWHRHLMADGEKGLIPAAAVGDGCLLIKRHVIEKLTPPWWEYGETLTDACDHDVVFSRKVTDAGFGLFCDLDVVVDHLTPFAIRPHRTADGKWECLIHQGEKDKAIALPAAHKGMEKA